MSTTTSDYVQIRTRSSKIKRTYSNADMRDCTPILQRGNQSSRGNTLLKHSELEKEIASSMLKEKIILLNHFRNDLDPKGEIVRTQSHWIQDHTKRRSQSEVKAESYSQPKSRVYSGSRGLCRGLKSRHKSPVFLKWKWTVDFAAC
ncbi:hypothetical protein L6452_30631 [Arctium lappa]|uniref:Uncharacterized protein n=1 Tax=Arctium lappa TaxID=4217 RepID=A0ACB8ZIX1_ARCLA|nr:hypothetical protein L6452_30631 [Arctium lappa]